MTELVFPHSIDAGTAMVANEVQSNFEAIETVVNGQLAGGSGSDGNLAANGITSRELAHNLLKYSLRPRMGFQQGIYFDTFGEGAVTPSANLTLAVAAFEGLIVDDTPIVMDVGQMVPVKYVGGTVTLDAAHA